MDWAEFRQNDAIQIANSNIRKMRLFESSAYEHAFN